MAYSNTDGPYSLPAAADFSTVTNNVPIYQHRFVVINGSGAIALCGDGVKADGILENFPAQGAQARYGRGTGVRKVRLGGNVSAYAKVASDANGQAITAASGKIVMGKALRGGTSGDIIEIEYDLSGTAVA